MDLFESGTDSLKPLAERMRPNTIEDFIGQRHLVGEGCLLRRAIIADRLGSCIFYGAPGTGKTTLANIIAHTTGANYVYLNAVSSGVAEAKKVIEDAKNRLKVYGKKTYLLLDECHRWNKAQSDSVLGAIEKGEIIFIGSTTENPFTSMTKAILSRCRIFEFKKLTIKDVKEGLLRALADKERGLGGTAVTVFEEALFNIAYAADGDLRSALNALELAVLSTNPNAEGIIEITGEVAEQSTQRRSLALDESQYYDVLSAFCKSIRGSDPDAALYYAMRMIDAGVDPLIICRRLIAHSAEDVGLADPEALKIAVCAMQAYEKIGLPEGKLPIAEAIIYVALAPKSNATAAALWKLSDALDARGAEVPIHLRDKNYQLTPITGYKYPHDYGGYVPQQYLPDGIKNERYYIPSPYGKEAEIIIKKLKN